MTERRETFERMLAAGQDSALLRFSLGTECIADGDVEAACTHLQRAVEQDPLYSAAWKALGKACAAAGETERAIAAYEQGIDVATRRGDVQAAKEMRVFLRRLQP